jgi:chemotaxis protein MotA
LALAGILGGLLLEKGQLSDIAQGTAAMIVLGGTVGAVLITNPLPLVVRAAAALQEVLLERSDSFHDAIDELIGYAASARKNGIVSLEAEANAVADPFLRKALSLAVDGTDLNVLKQMMGLEIELSEKRFEAEAKVWEAAGGYAPTIGIIGAVLGLIQVMKHLEDIREVGHGIAVAFVATVYGVGVANIVFLPVANKLKLRAHRTVERKEMMLDGVIGIVEGLNPKLIRLKLEAYAAIEEPQRSAVTDPGKAAAPGKRAATKGGPLAA